MGQTGWRAPSEMRRVIVSPAAYADLTRLEDWLIERAPNAASRLGPLLRSQMASLADLSERGRAGPRPGLRELVVRFGKGAYFIHYRVDETQVTVARIKHNLGRR